MGNIKLLLLLGVILPLCVLCSAKIWIFWNTSTNFMPHRPNINCADLLYRLCSIWTTENLLCSKTMVCGVAWTCRLSMKGGLKAHLPSFESALQLVKWHKLCDSLLYLQHRYNKNTAVKVVLHLDVMELG